MIFVQTVVGTTRTLKHVQIATARVSLIARPVTGQGTQIAMSVAAKAMQVLQQFFTNGETVKIEKKSYLD